MFVCPANDSSRRLIVRSCVLDSGSLTDETEIIRQSMCGRFYFDANDGLGARLCVQLIY